MKPLLCRLGLHSPCKTEYIEVTRRRSDRHGGKYHTNYICCRRCGKLCYRMRRRREKTIFLPSVFFVGTGEQRERQQHDQAAASERHRFL